MSATPLGNRPPVAVRYASEFTTSGYSIAARRCLLAMHGAGLDVCWQPLVDMRAGRREPVPPSEDMPPDLLALWRERGPDETLVLHSVPEGWQVTADELKPARLIGHSVWESDRLPRRWLHEMDVADELWVPTEWNRHVFAEALRRPVHVVPHVVTTTEPEPPPITLPDGAFVVVLSSVWDWRKRPDLALTAFLRAFRPGDPVVLVIKTNRMPGFWPRRQHIPTAAHIAEILEAAWPTPHVLIDTAVWTEAQMLGLYQRADCLLSMSAAEGWSLGPFDAASLGTPVVVNGYGGQVEWLGSDYPGLLPFRMVEATHPDPSLFEPGMSWGEADLDIAIEVLREVALGRDTQLLDRAADLAAELTTRYSPAAVAAKAAAALGGQA